MRAACRSPVKQCLLLPEDARAVLVGLAHVDDERLADLAREPDRPAQRLALPARGREVVVVVEPGLADRDDARVLGELGAALPILLGSLAGVVGMDGDGRRNLLRPLARQPERRAKLARRPP